MKILEFGNCFKSTVTFEYISTKTLLEFDMLFLDFDFILRNSSQIEGREYEKRKKHLEDFVNYKDIPLVFFTPVPRTTYVRMSGGGYQRDFDFFAPVPKIDTETEEGSQMDITPNNLFTDFMSKYKEYFHYNAYFKSKHGETIVSTPLTKYSLGFWNRECVFLPALKRTVQNVEEDFLKDLFAVIKRVRNSQPKVDLPEWTKSYFLPTEGELVGRINEILKAIQLLTEELQIKRDQYQFVTKKKAAFTSSGIELEKQIEEVLVEMGFTILEAENNREDLVVQFQDKLAIVEIKGVNGSSAEKHAAQLEKWSAQYFERTGNKPKPILIVNAFKDKPLIERKEEVFPNQMLKYSTSRDHCLISSLQLLGMYYYVQRHSGEINSQVEKLFSTVGVFKEFNKWDEYILLNN